MTLGTPHKHDNILSKVVTTLVVAMFGLVVVATLVNASFIKADNVDLSQVYALGGIMILFTVLLAGFSWVLVKLMKMSDE